MNEEVYKRGTLDIHDLDPAAEFTLEVENSYVLDDGTLIENKPLLFCLYLRDGGSRSIKIPERKDSQKDDPAKDGTVEAKILTAIASLDFIPRKYQIDHCYVDDLEGKVFRIYDVIFSGGENRDVLLKSFSVEEKCNKKETCNASNCEICEEAIYNTAFETLKYIMNNLSNEGCKKDLEDLLKKIRYAARFRMDVDIISYSSISEEEKSDASKERKLKFVLSYTVSVYRHLIGEYASALPLPRFYEPKLPFGENAVVVKACCPKSNQVWENLKKIDSILRRDHRSVVALVGAQGGGVTTYADALHQGQGKSKETLYPLSLAGTTYSEAMALLFGAVSSEGHYSEGAIERAAEGTLLIEDFDEIETEARRAIIRQIVRAIRTKEYSPLGSNLIRKNHRVDWIFTGQFDGNPAYWSDLPPEFTRLLTGKVEIKHPLVCGADSGENEVGKTKVCNRSDYLKELFYYFFMEDILKHCEGEKLELLLKNNKKRNSSFKLEAAYQLLTWGENIKKEDREKKLFKPGTYVQEIAALFIKKLDNCVKGEVTGRMPDSLRMVKQSARATVALLWSEAYGSTAAFSTMGDEKRKKLQEECAEEIKTVIKTIRPPNDLAKETSPS